MDKSLNIGQLLCRLCIDVIGMVITCQSISLLVHVVLILSSMLFPVTNFQNVLVNVKCYVMEVDDLFMLFISEN